jgi:flagellar protein FlaJ
MAKKETDIREQMEARFQRKDHRFKIVAICGVIAAIFFAIAVLNAVDELDFSLKGYTRDDHNNDGVCNALDTANAGYDSDGDGCPDVGENSLRRALNFMVFGIIVLMGPYGFYVSSKDKEVKEIEKRLPDFLRDVAEAGRFGMTLAEAIVVSSAGRYGRLTPEIKKMSAQIRWGVPVTHALDLFSERVDTPMTNRIVSIINKSSEAGGNVADVLTMVSSSTKERQLMEEERSVTMKTYLTVILISFFVFLVTIWILNATFLPKMMEASGAITAAGTSQGLDAGSILSDDLAGLITQIQIAFFLAAVIHAIGDGILAGVLENGKIANGMKYSFIMLISGFLIMEFLA